MCIMYIRIVLVSALSIIGKLCVPTTLNAVLNTSRPGSLIYTRLDKSNSCGKAVK